MLEVFNYHESASVVPCKDHTDIGVITVIPLSVNNAKGLQLFNWKWGKWMDIEDSPPEGLCVCFGGETLARATNNFIVPAVHRVASITQPRRSYPFLALARKGSILDCSKLDPKIVGNIVFEKPVEAVQFVNETSAKRVSSLFKAHL